ncbi:MAG: CDP-diacylglycerol--serine O-phosphatidyltransferase [Proteobacteria bacterium]|nr:CDP-diacylglycerol--serine O-phosphatidyltransferase [Pseudomonadota bacterium]
MNREERKKRIKDTSVLVFPNLFTTGNLFCGFYSIISSLKGNFILASYLILIATLFDMVDGRVARLLKGVSDFGKEYDSLSDLVSFGVAPSILVYMSYLVDIPRLGWLAAFLFVACGALRLARFNIMDISRDPRYFIGLPIPVAAATLASFFLFSGELKLSYDGHYWFLGLIFLMSFLMISAVNYKSYKKPEKAIKRKFYTNMVFFLLLLIVVAVNPQIIIFALCCVYIAQGLLYYIYNGVKMLFKSKKNKRTTNGI